MNLDWLSWNFQWFFILIILNYLYLCINLYLFKINTLEQLKNASNYQFLKDKIANNYIKGYALWVDVYTSDVYMFSYNEKRFVKIDENSYEKLYAECNTDFE